MGRANRIKGDFDSRSKRKRDCHSGRKNSSSSAGGTRFRARGRRAGTGSSCTRHVDRALMRAHGADGEFTSRQSEKQREKRDRSL